MKRRSAVDSVEYAAAQIRQAIVSGQYEPGERLIEINLSDKLGISRHPIREALRRLDREGLVQVRANRGAIVAEVDVPSLFEVYEIRASLGAIAIRHLLLQKDPLSAAAYKKLEQFALRSQKAAAENRQSDMIKADLEFQALVVEASGLMRVATYFRSLEADIQRFNTLLKIDYPEKEHFTTKHVVGLLHAIRDHNLTLAQSIWHDKFVTAVVRFAALVPDAGDWASDPRWAAFREGRLIELQHND